jgi:hypothetical protein
MRLRLAVIPLVLLATAVPAHANGATFLGGCGYGTAENRVGGALGGRNVWTGLAYLRVVPADPQGVPTGGAVTAWCEIRVNGTSQGTVLGPVSGTGAVAAAGPVQFRATVWDVVSLCTHVVTAAGTEVSCSDASTVQIVPQPIYDFVDYVGTPVGAVVDTAACAALGGDTTYDGYWLYDCPPPSS